VSCERPDFQEVDDFLTASRCMISLSFSAPANA
jgi:hypothetical protein